MLRQVIKFFLIFGLSLLCIGELDFRLLDREQRLEYDVDADLYWRLRPDQRGFEWLANMTKKSPPITINSQGFRGGERSISPDTVKVLAVGSSSAMGAGVEDNEVWTARLEQRLSEASLMKVAVFNAANPGWGPFQHAAFIEREAPDIAPDALVVMVSSGDLNFLPFTDPQEKAAYLKRSARKKQLAAISPFITFSFRKLETLLIRAKAQFNALLADSRQPSVTAEQTERRIRSLLQKVDKQKRYWLRITELAAGLQKPLIFMVLESREQKVNEYLQEVIQQMSRHNPYVSVVTIDTAAHNVNDLVIAGDGHPNARYHALMAQQVSPSLLNRLGNKLMVEAAR